jgi:hypothetical protein
LAIKTHRAQVAGDNPSTVQRRGNFDKKTMFSESIDEA